MLDILIEYPLQLFYKILFMRRFKHGRMLPFHFNYMDLGRIVFPTKIFKIPLIACPCFSLEKVNFTIIGGKNVIFPRSDMYPFDFIYNFKNFCFRFAFF